jgi:hypothetical protein
VQGGDRIHDPGRVLLWLCLETKLKTPFCRVENPAMMRIVPGLFLFFGYSTRTSEVLPSILHNSQNNLARSILPLGLRGSIPCHILILAGTM